MKQFFLRIFCLLFLSTGLISATVTNTTTPKLGTWDFKIKEVLKLDSYGDQPLAMVHKVAIHNDGRVFIFDRTHFKFFVFDSKGKLINSFGKRGEGPGEIKIMLDFYLLEDRIIAWDMGKIHHLSLDGKLIKSVPNSSTIGIAPHMFLDQNRIVKTTRNFGRVRRGVSSSGPSALEIYDTLAKKSIFLDGKKPESKNGMGGTMVMISVGNSRNERSTNYITEKYQDRILWGKNDAYLIHLVDSSGNKKLSFSIADKKRTPITQADKELLVSRLNVQVSGQSAEDFKKRYIKSIPNQCTYFSKIATDKNGLIYVFTSNVALNNGREIDIFSPKGVYLYQSKIEVGEGESLKANGIIFKGDFLYITVEDEEGELSLRKYSCNLPAQR